RFCSVAGARSRARDAGAPRAGSVGRARDPAVRVGSRVDDPVSAVAVRGFMQNVTAEFQGSLSADVVPPAARIAFWNQLSSRLFGSVRIDSRSRAPFHSELLRISLRDF